MYNNTDISSFIKSHIIKYLNSLYSYYQINQHEEKVKLYFQLHLKLCYSIFQEGNLMPTVTYSCQKMLQIYLQFLSIQKFASTANMKRLLTQNRMLALQASIYKA